MRKTSFYSKHVRKSIFQDKFNTTLNHHERALKKKSIKELDGFEGRGWPPPDVHQSLWVSSPVGERKGFGLKGRPSVWQARFPHLVFYTGGGLVTLTMARLPFTRLANL